MFSYFERLLDVVPRWSTAPRLHPQTVAAHSFYATLYASKLCQKMQLPESDRLKVLEYTLRHDVAEALTGDTPGPIKRHIVDKEKLKKLEASFTTQLGADYWHNELDPHLRAIVKAADLIDEFMWISMEVLMGNRMLEPQRSKVQARLIRALTTISLSALFPELLEESAKMARGVDFFQDDSDL